MLPPPSLNLVRGLVVREVVIDRAYWIARSADFDSLNPGYKGGSSRAMTHWETLPLPASGEREQSGHAIILFHRNMRLAAATHLRRSRCLGSHDPLEVGLRSGVAVDRHVCGHIKLQPLDIAVERNRIRADEGQRPAGRRGPVHVGIDD